MTPCNPHHSNEVELFAVSDPCSGRVRPDSEIEGVLETAFLIGIKYLTGVNTTVRPESFISAPSALYSLPIK